MTGLPSVSVVIPTYNRRQSLLRCLESLAEQSYPVDRCEVIVVDDGGTDGSMAVSRQPHQFLVRYLWQPNQGDAAARNHGALAARGPILQFVDDDLLLDRHFLEHMVRAVTSGSHRLVFGALLPVEARDRQAPASAHDRSERIDPPGAAEPFAGTYSGVLAVRRQEFLDLGMMQPLPTLGSSLWCDVELVHRARQAGWTVVHCRDAIAYHDDYSQRDLSAACARWFRAGQSAVQLFRRHPGLREQLPMFRDKTPIEWRRDDARLILRKLARRVASSEPVMFVLQQAASQMESRAPNSRFHRALVRWIVGGYIHRGYRRGFAELARTGRG